MIPFSSMILSGKNRKLQGPFKLLVKLLDVSRLSRVRLLFQRCRFFKLAHPFHRLNIQTVVACLVLDLRLCSCSMQISVWVGRSPTFVSVVVPPFQAVCSVVECVPILRELLGLGGFPGYLLLQAKVCVPPMAHVASFFTCHIFSAAIPEYLAK